MKTSRDLILGEVFYIAIIYHIPDYWIYLLNGYDFYFDHMTGVNRELSLLNQKIDRKPEVF